MHFRNLSLGKSRKFVISERKSAPKSSGRRNFVKTMGMGIIAWNPLVDSIQLLSKAEFQLKRKKNNLLFYSGNKLCWEFSEQVFEPGFIIDFKQFGNEYFIHIEGLRYLNTCWEFSLRMSLYLRHGHWRINIQIPELQVSQELDLMGWLNGNICLQSKNRINQKIATLNNQDQIKFNGNFKISLNNKWELQLQANDGFQLIHNQSVFISDRLLIQPHSEEMSELIFLKHPMRKGTILFFPEFRDWPSMLSKLQINSGKFKSAPLALPTLQILLSEEKILIVHHRHGNIFLRNKMRALDIRFQRYLYYAEYQNGNAPQIYFSANFPRNELRNSDISETLKTKRPLQSPDFEAVGYGNQLRIITKIQLGT